jgi:hypothetical protein
MENNWSLFFWEGNLKFLKIQNVSGHSEYIQPLGFLTYFCIINEHWYSSFFPNLFDYVHSEALQKSLLRKGYLHLTYDLMRTRSASVPSSVHIQRTTWVSCDFLTQCIVGLFNRRSISSRSNSQLCSAPALWPWTSALLILPCLSRKHLEPHSACDSPWLLLIALCGLR